jgi:hypothetical protein
MKPQVGFTTTTGFVLVEKIETITRLSEAIGKMKETIK